MDANNSILLGRPLLWDAKVSHDYDNNLVTIQGNGIIKLITITKHLSIDTKWPKVLLCYDFQHGITNDEEDVMFTT
jgi:hypothetical protein